MSASRLFVLALLFFLVNAPPATAQIPLGLDVSAGQSVTQVSNRSSYGTYRQVDVSLPVFWRGGLQVAPAIRFGIPVSQPEGNTPAFFGYGIHADYGLTQKPLRFYAIGEVMRLSEGALTDGFLFGYGAGVEWSLLKGVAVGVELAERRGADWAYLTPSVVLHLGR